MLRSRPKRAAPRRHSAPLPRLWMRTMTRKRQMPPRPLLVAMIRRSKGSTLPFPLLGFTATVFLVVCCLPRYPCLSFFGTDVIAGSLLDMVLFLGFAKRLLKDEKHK